MTMLRRLLVLLAVALAVLVLPAVAGARLVVSTSTTATGSPGSTAIRFDGGAAAELVFLVPPRFGVDLGQPAGTRLGRASASLDVQGSPLDASGAIVAEDPALTACGTSLHAAVWRLSLAGAPEVLVAVDGVGPADPEAVYASYRLTACPASGVLVRSLDLELDRVFASPSRAGAYVWRALAVPAGSGGAPDPTAAVESRSTQLLPVRLELHGSFDRAKGTARLAGVLRAGGKPISGARVAIASGRPGATLAPSGSAATTAGGRFEESRPIAEATVFRASADVPARSDPAGCPAPVAPAGCADATIAPLTAESGRVTVRVPPPRVVRLGSRGADVRRLREELVRLRYLPPGARSAVFDERTWHAVVALQGWMGLPRTGVVDRRTWRALERARTPVPWAALRRGVLIDTSRQVLLLVEGGRTVRAIHVSTGAYGRTPRGRFAVYRKETLSWSVPFSVWMPYASYFRGGFAMHAYSSVPTYPASHGCVRIPPVEAPVVYRFAGYGTPVWIR